MWRNPNQIEGMDIDGGKQRKYHWMCTGYDKAISTSYKNFTGWVASVKTSWDDGSMEDGTKYR